MDDIFHLRFLLCYFINSYLGCQQIWRGHKLLVWLGSFHHQSYHDPVAIDLGAIARGSAHDLSVVERGLRHDRNSIENRRVCNMSTMWKGSKGWNPQHPWKWTQVESLALNDSLWRQMLCCCYGLAWAYRRSLVTSISITAHLHCFKVTFISDYISE